MSHPVVHWEIGGRDMPALRDFYAKAFGWTVTQVEPDYSIVAPDDGGLAGGIMQVAHHAPPYVTVYVATDDLDASLAEIASLGGATLVPPTTISESMSFALFRDPEGNVVGLLKHSPVGSLDS